MKADEFRKLTKRDFENGATTDDIYLTLQKHEKMSDLLYRFAKHIKNKDNLPVLEWGVKGIDLLVELRDIDPEAYNKNVKGMIY